MGQRLDTLLQLVRSRGGGLCLGIIDIDREGSDFFSWALLLMRE